MANNWAIVIGINHYVHLAPERHLRFAVRDAEKMKTFLSDYAGFPSQNILLCTDNSQPVGTISTRPALTNLQRLLLEHVQHATDAENFWFFFAGHGMVGNDRQDYLLPCDSYPAYLRGSAIPINFVTECLRDCRAKNIVLILDMCRREGLYPSRDIGLEFGEQTIEIAKQQGIITIFSCSRGEYSYEIPALQQGAFTHTLIQGLNKHTILRQLAQYLNREVPALNRKYGLPTQVPLIISEPAGKYDLSLLPQQTTEADINELIQLATYAELEEKFENAKALWLQIIQASRSTTRLTDAQKAIDRINNKINRLQAPSKPYEKSANNTQLNQQLTSNPQQSLLPPTASTQAESSSRTASISPASSSTTNEDDLSSEHEIDYTQLRDLLKAGKWKEADKETLVVMCRATGRSQEGWLRPEDIDSFPCTDLHTIDNLWKKYSKGKFGFSIQNIIYLQSRPNTYGGWSTFGARVGWRVNKKWLLYHSLTFDSSARRGHLPVAWLCGSLSAYTSEWGSQRYWGREKHTSLPFSALSRRLTNCDIGKPSTPKSKSHPQTAPQDEDNLSSERFGANYYAKLRDLT